jgi:hypothetical protein
MPTAIEPEATQQPIASDALPGVTPGLTKMEEAFKRAMSTATPPADEGEWRPEPAQAQKPKPSNPEPAPEPQPKVEKAPEHREPEKPKSPFDFTKPADTAAEQPKPAKADGELPPEIKSAKAAEHWRTLQAARDAEQTRANTAEAKAKALEQELAKVKTKAVDSESMDLLRKENEELSKRIAVLDVTQHPKFQSYFGGKETAIVDQIKSAAGPELSGRLINLLKSPDTLERANMLTEAISELPIWSQQKITNYAMALDALRTEKEQAIAESSKARDTLLAEDQQRTESQKRESENMFLRVLAQAQDPNRGVEVLVPKDGDEAHNAEVRAAVETARDVYSGKLTPDEMARAAMWAAAAPMYRKAVFAQAALIKKYEDQIKGLTAATPGLTGKQSSAHTESPKGGFMEKFKEAYLGDSGANF